jgi:hypothetical protein
MDTNSDKPAFLPEEYVGQVNTKKDGFYFYHEDHEGKEE